MPKLTLPPSFIQRERVCRQVGYPASIRVDNVLSAEENGDTSQSLSVRQHALAA